MRPGYLPAAASASGRTDSNKSKSLSVPAEIRMQRFCGSTKGMAASLDRQMEPGGPAIGGHRDRPRRCEGGAEVKCTAQLQGIEYVAQYIHLPLIACFETMG